MSDYRLGDRLPLRVQTHNADGAPVTPDACPTVDIYDSAGTKVVTAKAIPIQDRYGTTGLFFDHLLLDGTFSTGQYLVRYKWAASGYDGVRISQFRVIAGGNVRGQYVSMTFYPRPFAKFLVGQTDSGTIERVRNPKF